MGIFIGDIITNIRICILMIGIMLGIGRIIRVIWRNCSRGIKLTTNLSNPLSKKKKDQNLKEP